MSVPPFAVSAAAEVTELCELAGLFLDPWQKTVLHGALGERPDGRWASFEVGLCVSRQNGKGSILEARELAGLFVLGERLIIHSSHQFDTSLEAFRRLLFLIEETPDLEARVKRVSRSHGEEGIELKTGQRIRFRTRTKGGGRGFTGDCVILDEAMILPESTLGALMPTVSARPNPQIWYTGSAVDQLIHDDGIVFARVRERGTRGNDPSLAYFEWSAPFGTPDEVTDQGNPEHWAAANPAMGIRISAEHVGNEQRSMDPRTFAVERLGVGDWPHTDGTGQAVISLDTWAGLADPESKPGTPLVFAYDVTPDRSRASISVAAVRSDGLLHTELVDRRSGTAWVAGELASLEKKHHPSFVVGDSVGPAASLAPEIEQAGVTVTAANTTDLADACGTFYDHVERGTLRHLGTDDLANSLRGAVKRPLGDRWAWSRKNSRADISPLVACTLAVWQLDRTRAQRRYTTRGFA